MEGISSMNNGQKVGTNDVPTGVSKRMFFRTDSTCPKDVPEKPASPIDMGLGQMSQMMSQMSRALSTHTSLSVFIQRECGSDCPDCLKTQYKPAKGHTSSFDWDGHRPSLLLKEPLPQRRNPFFITVSANRVRPTLAYK